MHSHPPRVLRFDVFTLDLSRCILLREDEQLALRPQAFDVLRYLAEHGGRIVSKEELLAAIWDAKPASDDSLVQCIKDIRQALGDAARGIIQTVPRRGYLFDAQVSEAAALPLPGGEGGAKRRVGGTEVILAAPTPNPSPQGGGEPVAAALLVAAPGRGRRATLLVAGVLIALVGALLTADSRRGPAPNASAAHYVILGRAILDKERSAKAAGEALALFDKALGIDPDCVPALLGYTMVLVADIVEGWSPRDERPARLDQAETAVERAIKLEAKSERGHFYRGVLLRLRGDPDRAMTAFEHALLLHPNYAWAHAELGRVKIEVGRAEESIKDIEMAIRLSPREGRIYVWYIWAGFAVIHTGDGEAALRWALKAHQARPYGLTVPLLALAYAYVSREAEGRALMAEYVAKTPSFTMAALTEDYPRRNSTVARQRDRMFDVLRRLGVPEGAVRTGPVRY